MLDIQQKRKVRSFLYNKVSLAILAVIALFFMHSTWSVYQKMQSSKAFREAALDRVEELRARDRDLKDKIDRLDTDAGIEEEIRSKFSVAKDNEAMVIVVSEEEGEAYSTSSEASFWDRVKSYFKK